MIIYGVTVAGRSALEAYDQIIVLYAPWYDIPSAILNELSIGFVPHILISAGVTEAIKMVLADIYESKNRRKAQSQANGQLFDEPPPDSTN